MNLLPFEENGIKYFNITQLAVKFGVHPSFFTAISKHFPVFLTEKYINKIRGSLSATRNHFTEEFYEKFFPVLEELRKTHVCGSKTSGKLEDKFVKKVRKILETEYARSAKEEYAPYKEGDPENKVRVKRKEWDELSAKISFIYDFCVNKTQK